MNRKQKKAKRLKATHHTKSQARACTVPLQQRGVDGWPDEQEWFERKIETQFEPSKNTGKRCLLLIALCMLATWLIFKK